MGLGVNNLALTLVLLSDLLLVRHFPHLPLRRREDEDSRRTCWTRIRSEASVSEYPFALIAAGMESLVTGFGSQAKKKRAAFFARASTLYSFLFEDIALIKRELGPTDEEAPKKGKRLR